MNILSPYHTTTRLDDGSLALYSTVTGRLHITTEAVYKQLQDGNTFDIDSSIIKDLKSSKILIESMKDAMLPSPESDKLRLVILPTGQCNLRCVYCGLQKAAGKISKRKMDEIVFFAKDRLAEKDYKRIQVDWFGGEPTLHVNEIRYLTKKLLSVTEEHNLSYSSRLVTNGILLDEENTKILIEECKVSFIEITLDGAESYNDARRKNLEGTGFYNQVIQNVERLCNLDDMVSISIRCNVDQSNVKGVYPLLEDLRCRGIHNKCSFYIAMIHSWGSETGSQALPIEAFAELQFKVLQFMIANGFTITNDIILPFSSTKRICTNIDDSSYVIDHYGNIYCCTETPYTSDKASILGNIGRRKLLQRRTYTTSPENLSECLRCPVYTICGGGCQKRFLEHGQPECIPLRFNINKRIRLFMEVNKFGTKRHN